MPGPTATPTSSESVQVTALGVTIDVTHLSPEEACELRTAWSRCLGTGEEESVGEVARVSGNYARANELITSRVTLKAIEHLAGELMMFHACGLADPDTGATVAFIAPSGTGKTTVARTLGRDWGYVSDETIAVRADLSIVAYPKPLSVKQAEPGVPKLQEGPDSLGLGATRALPVLSRITLLRRLAEDTPVSLEAVPLAEAILELTPQLSALARMDRGLVQLCTMIAACGGVRRISYSEAATIAAILPKLVADAGATDDWSTLELGVFDTADAPEHGIRRTLVEDAIDIDGTVFLLSNSKVLQLGPLGALVWELSDAWITREALLARIVLDMGEHPQAAELLDEAIAELLSKGVIESR